MADELEFIISAIDSASEVFQNIISSAQEMADGISGSVGTASSDFETISSNVSEFQSAVDNVDSTELETLAETLGMDTEEVERLLSVGADIGSLSAGFNEVASAADELEQEIQEDTDALQEFGSAGDVMGAQTFMDIATGMKDAMLGAADSAGTFNDSIMRASLEAQGAGISVEEMKNVVSELSSETGRAGGQIRESFIKATARGVTDMDSFRTMMKGAGAQATLFNTSIESMGNKFSSMAQKDTLMQRSLAETGITMNELADAMGMTGATADEVKDKWKELDTNQRAAILGQAASMNEGKTANDEYKTSWAGLQEQLDIAKGRLERIVGSVILPVLIPAMQIASDILSGLGDTVDFIMRSPLGGLVSVLGALAGAFMIAVTGAAALRSFIAFLKVETLLESAATVFNTATKILNGEASSASAIANMLLGESFMASAAAAWSAAVAFIAATWPLWVIVGAILAVVAVAYELGKAFGWWTDVGSMIDAIKAGIQRLWDAFINHPDVQAVISALSSAWDYLAGAIGWVIDGIMSFFNISNSGEFDVVQALIMAIGDAWNFIREPIAAVIEIISTVVGVVYSVLTGNLDVVTGIQTIWSSLVANIPVILNTLYTIFMTIWGNILLTVLNAASNMLSGIVQYVSQIPGRVFNFLNRTRMRIISSMVAWVNVARERVRQFFNGIVNGIVSLPGRVYSLLHGVVSRIRSAIQGWISTASQKVSELIKSITSPFSGVTSAISSALSGVVDTITAPFRQAWEDLEPIVSKIQDAMSIIGGSGGDAAGGLAAGGFDEFITQDNIVSVESDETVLVEFKDDLDLNINVDGLPDGVSTDDVLALFREFFNDQNVKDDFIRYIVGSSLFQRLDNKAKTRLLNKGNRARGV